MRIKRLKFWAEGIRLYIAIGIGLITLETLWWVRANFYGSRLLQIRVAESYAWLSVIFLFITLLIGPLYKVLPRLPGKLLARDARRMLGIGAAWFASIHVLVSVFGLLGGLSNLLSLPPVYEKSFLIGAASMIVLLAMAFTSFDGAMRKLGKWWFRIHRAVYAAGLLLVLHAVLVGSHAMDRVGFSLLAAMVSVILGLNGYCLLRSKNRQLWQLAALVLYVLSASLILKFGYSQYKSNTYIEKTRPGPGVKSYE